MMIIPLKSNAIKAYVLMILADSDSVRMGGKSCDYLFFDELYYIFFHDTKYEPV